MVMQDVSSDLMLQAVEASHDGIVIADLQQPDQPIIYANPAFEVMTGYSHEQVVGRNCRFLQGVDHQQEGLAVMRAAISKRTHCEVTLRNYKKNGELFYNRLSLSPVLTDKGEARYYIGIQKDVSHEIMLTKNLKRVNTLYAEMNESLLQESQVDLLTGLHNQRYIDEAAPLLFNNACREHWKLNFYFIDIDDFKHINNYFGHATGDVCLQALANQISAVFSRSGDICARLSADQFLVITVCHGSSEINQQAELLRDSIKNLSLYSEEHHDHIAMNTTISTRSLTPTIADNIEGVITDVISELAYLRSKS